LSLKNQTTTKLILLIEPQYLPSIAFFVYALQYQPILFEVYANYQRSSYTNRTYIAGANGKQRLSIPLVGGSRQKNNIIHLNIDFSENWAKEHWYAIQSAYAKAAFFEYYEDDMRRFFQSPIDSLLTWSLQWFNWLCEQLNFQPVYESTEKYIPSNILSDDIYDARNLIRPNQSYDLLLQNLHYYQLFNEKHGFIYNLSVLDLLMSEGPNALSLLKQLVAKT